MEPQNVTTEELVQQIDMIKGVLHKTKQENILYHVTTASAALILLQGGFALREFSSGSYKNVSHIMVKSLMALAIGISAAWMVGFGLSYAEGNVFLGYMFFPGNFVRPDLLPRLFLHLASAIIIPPIVSGAMSGRTRIVAHLLMTLIVTVWVFPVASHWAQSEEGWLHTYPINTSFTRHFHFQDSGGSGVIHVLGGVIALVGAVLIGPREDRFGECGKVNDESFRSHNIPLSFLGGFIVIFGLFALNGISSMVMSVKGEEGHELVSLSILVSASSAVSTIMATYYIYAKVMKTGFTWSASQVINGFLIGMISVGAGADTFQPWSAAVVGVFAGYAYILWCWVLTKCKVDDPLDSVSVHLGGGCLALIAAPVFHEGSGIVYAWSLSAFMKFAWNIAGLVAIIGWGLLHSLILFFILRHYGFLRVSKTHEINGLDEELGSDPAYLIHSDESKKKRKCKSKKKHSKDEDKDLDDHDIIDRAFIESLHEDYMDGKNSARNMPLPGLPLPRSPPEPWPPLDDPPTPKCRKKCHNRPSSNSSQREMVDDDYMDEMSDYNGGATHCKKKSRCAEGRKKSGSSNCVFVP